MRQVGKRTVYSEDEIDEIAKKPTLVIIFRLHFHIAQISHKLLLEKGIVNQIPQSIMVISHENYLKIKKLGRIKTKYTVS